MYRRKPQGWLKHIDFLLERRELLDAHIALLENKLSKIERTGELRR